MAKWKNVSKDEFEQLIATSCSLQEICKKLGCPGFRASVLKQIQEYNLDLSSLKKQGWRKDQYDWDKFEKGKVVSSALALPALEHKRGHRCEKCGQSTWLDLPIPLEVHHRDGDKLNNEESNLELLCLNCHALTDNFRGKNRDGKHSSYISNEDFAAALSTSKNIRQALLRLGLTAKGANYARAREIAIKFDIKHILEP